MFFPYAVDVPMERRPWANWLIIAGTIVACAYAFSQGEAYDDILTLQRGEDFHWYQLVGSLIGHADWGHLLGNMYFLYLFGNAINSKVGHLYYPLLYMGIGIIEGLVWLMVGSGWGTLGASGAIMGIIGAFLVMYPRNNVSVYIYLGVLSPTHTFEISAYWVILTYIGFDVWGLVRSGDHVVNYVAHLAGAATGFAAMWALLSARLVTSDSDEQSLLDLLREAKSPRKSSKRRASSSASQEPDWARFPAPQDAPTLPRQAQAPAPPSPPRPRPAANPASSTTAAPDEENSQRSKIRIEGQSSSIRNTGRKPGK